MARKIELHCDICRKPTEKIVAKLFFTPSIPGISTKVHSNYTYSCDVGVCCEKKLLRGFNFRKRLKAAEYHEQRRKASSG